MAQELKLWPAHLCSLAENEHKLVYEPPQGISYLFNLH